MLGRHGLGRIDAREGPEKATEQQPKDKFPAAAVFSAEPHPMAGEKIVVAGIVPEKIF